MPEKFETPRDWMLWSYGRNRDGFRKEISEPDAVPWSTPGILIGALCLHPIINALICLAAGDGELGDAFLNRARARTDEAVSRFGANVELDQVALYRVQIVLSDRFELAAGVAGHRTGTLPVPYEAFHTYCADRNNLPEERNAAQFYWALFALFDGNEDELRSALATKSRKHPDFVNELALLPQLPAMIASDDAASWLPFEEVASRWLNPKLMTQSYACTFQNDFALLLSLIWTKYRLRSINRDTLLRTYLGETLSVPVPVGA